MAQINLFPEFRELFELLNSAKVSYILIGGYAVNYHGYHRPTGDIDVWIATDAANAKRVATAIAEFVGVAPGRIAPETFEKRQSVFIIGVPPRRVDILSDPAGIDFDDCYKRRIEVSWDGIQIPVISLADLTANKKAAGRPKDIADVAYLQPTLPKAKSPTRRKRKK